MFADDVASCLETHIRLQNQINVIASFCSETGMEVNLDKTEKGDIYAVMKNGTIMVIY